MDWATFFDKYSDSLFALGGVCIGTIASFVGLLLGYFFQKKNDERKRAWELEDRKSDRRTAIHDMRIKEARDYLDTYLSIIQRMTELEGSLMIDSIGTTLNPIIIKPETFEDKEKSFQEIVRLAKDMIKNQMSISILNDLELNKQISGLLSLVYDELMKITDVIKKPSAKRPYESKENYVKRVLLFNEKATESIQVMQTRLDEIAKTVS